MNNISRIDSIISSDITADGMEDFILILNNSTMMALCGASWSTLWMHSAPAGSVLKYGSFDQADNSTFERNFDF